MAFDVNCLKRSALADDDSVYRIGDFGFAFSKYRNVKLVISSNIEIFLKGNAILAKKFFSRENI